jgi:cold shock CspA family protein
MHIEILTGTVIKVGPNCDWCFAIRHDKAEHVFIHCSEFADNEIPPKNSTVNFRLGAGRDGWPRGVMAQVIETI